jgi:NADH-quinone oxidoreductase subunit A
LGFAVSTLLSYASIWVVREVHHREKLTPYECGFSPIRKLNQPFSVRFFLMAILFLVFELEVVTIFP